MDGDSPADETETPSSRRLVLALIVLAVLPASAVVSRAYELLPVCCVPLVMLGGALTHGDRAEPTDDSEGPGGNGGSPTRGPSPNLPRGGGLLPDAEPAARRYRGEASSPLVRSRTRRPAHPPQRRPVPSR